MKLLLKKLFFNICCIVGLILSLAQFEFINAQNVAFTQYHLAPAQSNPALIATSNQTRVIFNYRHQFIASGQSFTTPMLSVLYPYIRKKDNKRLAAFGISVLQDKTGEGGILTTTGGLLTSAINLSLNPKSASSSKMWLSFGVQGGFFQRVINVNALTSGSQWTGSVFDEGLPLTDFTGLENQNVNKSFPVIHAGTTFYVSDTCDNVKAFLGIEMRNINQPNISFFNDTEDKIPTYFSVVAGANVFQNEKIIIQPNVRFLQQDKVQSIRAGSLAYYNFSDKGGFVKDGNIGVGLWYDLNNSLAMSLEVNQPKYSIGFSYDMGVTQPINALGASAWEISFGLKFGKKCFNKPIEEPQISDYDTLTNEKKIFDEARRYLGDSIYVVVAEIIKGEPYHIDTISKSFRQEDVMVLIPTDEDLKILKKQAFFYYVSYDLNNSSKAILDQMAEMLNKFRGVEIEIEGHTCNIGETEQINQILSENRSKAVKSYLVSKGVAENRVVFSGYGSSRPILSNKTEYGRIKNRRVEFKLLKTGAEKN